MEPGLHLHVEQTTLGDGLIIAFGRTCVTFIKKIPGKAASLIFISFQLPGKHTSKNPFLKAA